MRSVRQLLAAHRGRIVDVVGVALVAIAAGMLALPAGLALGGVGLLALNWSHDRE